MLAAIEFYQDSSLQAHQVKNVVSEWMLSSEFAIVKLTTT